MKRVSVELKPGMVKHLQVEMPANLASAATGATATGDGINLGKLIDDTEATNWASLESAVAGKQVTVRLDPSKPWHQVARVQVSASCEPGFRTTRARYRDPEPLLGVAPVPGPDLPGEGGRDCTQDSRIQRVVHQRADVFLGGAATARSELLMKSFTVPKTNATFVRLRVLTNQCTGTPTTRATRTTTPERHRLRGRLHPGPQRPRGRTPGPGGSRQDGRPPPPRHLL